jgi:L-asparagine oxygenase
MLNELRESPSLCALRISGVHLDPDRCGPTPLSWQEALDNSRQDLKDAQLALLASCLGEVFAWPTIQQGRMAQNLVPVESGKRSRRAERTTSCTG